MYMYLVCIYIRSTAMQSNKYNRHGMLSLQSINALVIAVYVVVVYFLILICMCVLAVVVTIIVQHLYLRSESRPLVSMPTWVSKVSYV